MNWKQPSENDIVTLHDCTVLAKSTKAFVIEREYNEKWVALSQVHNDIEVFEIGDTGKLVVPFWLAEKNGWT